MRASKNVTAAIVGAMALGAGTGVSAHRVDEFLQAARIAIEPNRVTLELSLTPGIAMTDGLLREIDANKDGALSSSEQLEYAGHVLGGITLRIDDAPPLRLKLTASNFPDIESMRTGDGVIAIRSETEVPRLTAGAHHLVFRNDNGPGENAGSVFLANALLPDDDQISVTRQEREADQRALTIDFTVAGPGRAWTWMPAVLLILAAFRLRPKADGTIGRRVRNGRLESNVRSAQ